MNNKPIFDETNGGQPDTLKLLRCGQAYYELGEWQPALDCLEQALAVCLVDKIIGQPAKQHARAKLQQFFRKGKYRFIRNAHAGSGYVLDGIL